MKGLLKISTDCSGLGAPEQALKQLNIPHRTLFACDKDKYARQSYLANHECEIMYEDITTRKNEGLEQADIYVAGFPCQAFSLVGERLGFEDTRGTIFYNCADYIKQTRPRAFLAENVTGLISHNGGRTFQTMINLLAKTVNGQIILPYYNDNLGYHVFYSILNTKDYNLPQSRGRVYIVGFRDDADANKFRMPRPMPLALRLGNLAEGEVDEKYYHSPKMLEYMFTRPANFNRGVVEMKCFNDIAAVLVANQHKFNISDNTIVVNEKRNAIALEMPNITRETYKEYTGRLRKITPRECLRVQGFTDDFKQVVSDTQMYIQTGNTMSTTVVGGVLSNIINSFK